MKGNKVAERSIKRKIILFHYYYKRTGLYTFLRKNLIKLGIAMLSLLLIVFFAKLLLRDVDINMLLQSFVALLPAPLVLSLFMASESLLGLIPPDIFIIWAKGFNHPYLIVGILAVISYLGGIVSFYIGKLINKSKKVNNYIEKRFSKKSALIQKWGGGLIVFSALFPLPFSAISVLAGMVRYPAKTFFILGTTRFLRFYLYAIPLFSIIG